MALLLVLGSGGMVKAIVTVSLALLRFHTSSLPV